jgi:hypothetical protein
MTSQMCRCVLELVSRVRGGKRERLAFAEGFQQCSQIRIQGRCVSRPTSINLNRVILYRRCRYQLFPFCQPVLSCSAIHIYHIASRVIHIYYSHHQKPANYYSPPAKIISSPPIRPIWKKYILQLSDCLFVRMNRS